VLRLSKLAATEPFLLRSAGAVDLAPPDEGAPLARHIKGATAP
jgi:hypothetical protein